MVFSKKNIKVFLIIFFLIISSYLFFSYSHTTSNIPSTKNNLIIHYINVGQGDCTLIQINNKNMLIDAGPPNKMAFKYLKKMKIKTLDYIIATHPHNDHIGDMECIINYFKVNNFYAPNIKSNSYYFKRMLLSLKNKNIPITLAKSGIKIPLDTNINCTLLAPNNSHYDKINNYSAVLKINHKNNSFLFCGDAECESENEILENNYNIEADILKLGHHGSKTSTTKKFLKRINPKIGIISCGKNNDYGHPHKDVINRLLEHQVSIYRTDLDGNIILISNGNKILKI